MHLCFFVAICVVLSSSTDGVLRIDFPDPLTKIAGPIIYTSQTQRIFPNRTAVSTEVTVTMSFSTGHVGDDMRNYNIPTVMWLKDEAPAKPRPVNTAVGSNSRLGSRLTFYFQASDAGVYQCIFNGSGSQMYWAFPLRLDTG